MTEKLPVLTTTELERCRFKESCSSGYGKLDDSTVNRLIAYVAEKQRDADLKVVERLEAEIAALRLQLLNEQRRGDTYWQIMRQDEGLMGGSMETRELMQQAVDKWGRESQLDMVIEECAELIDSIQKMRNSGGRIF